MNLRRQQFKDTNLSDQFFDSLKADYPEFSKWFAKKTEDWAFVFYNESNFIDGFCT